MGKSEANRRISGCGFFKWEDSDQGSSSKLSTTTAFASNSSKKIVEMSSKSFSAFLADTVNAQTDRTHHSKVPAKLPLSKTVSSIISDKSVGIEPCQRVLLPPTDTMRAASTAGKTVLQKPLNCDSDTAPGKEPTLVSKDVQSVNKTFGAPSSKRPVATSLSQEPMTKVLRPTLGVARPTSVSDLRTLNLDNGLKSPQTKRARLSFNAPSMSFGKGVHQGRVAQQYFGNVPLQQQ